MAAITPKRMYAAAGLSQYLLPAAAVTVVAAVAAGGFVALRNLIAGKGDKGGFLPSARDVGEAAGDFASDAVVAAGTGVYDFFGGIYDAGAADGAVARARFRAWFDSLRIPFVDPVVDPVVPSVSAPAVPAGGGIEGIVRDAIESYYDPVFDPSSESLGDWMSRMDAVYDYVDFGDTTPAELAPSVPDSWYGRASSGVITSPAGAGGLGLDPGSGGDGTYPDSWYA